MTSAKPQRTLHLKTFLRKLTPAGILMYVQYRNHSRRSDIEMLLDIQPGGKESPQKYQTRVNSIITNEVTSIFGELSSSESTRC